MSWKVVFFLCTGCAIVGASSEPACTGKDCEDQDTAVLLQSRVAAVQDPNVPSVPNAPQTAPEPVVPVQGWCQNGSTDTKKELCCAKSCGSCGGSGCGGRPGGGTLCCTGAIRKNDEGKRVVCSSFDDTLCAIPQGWCRSGSFDKKKELCCAKSCGSCGGSGCGGRPGGGTLCCSGAIRKNDEGKRVVCSSVDDTLCAVPKSGGSSDSVRRRSSTPDSGESYTRPACTPNATQHEPSGPPQAEKEGVADVKLAEDGITVVYFPDSQGDTIPDFACVGAYKDLRPLPTAPHMGDENLFAQQGEGDDTARIQAAIDKVSALPIDDSTGLRGYVQFAAGEFRVASTINVLASGVVLKGIGNDTVLRATSPRQYKVVSFGGSARIKRHGSKVSVSDQRVPVGAKEFNVDDASSFAVGDLIEVFRPSTEKWIRTIGMDRICPAGKAGCSNWTASGYSLKAERVIQKIDGTKITIDAPLVQALDKEYGGGKIYKITDTGRIRNVGIEALTISSDFDKTIKRSFKRHYAKYGLTGWHYADENHANNGVHFSGVKDGWATGLTCKHLVYACVDISRSAKYITVEKCRSLQPVSNVQGGRRYSFNVVGQLNLVRNCYTELGRHDYVTSSRVMGPNVFVHSTSKQALSDIGPHHRWGVGQLYDNIQGGEMAVRDRGSSGSGHGWSGNTIVFYNCESKLCHGGPVGIQISSPTTGANYCIGCTADAWQIRNTVTCDDCGRSGPFLSQGHRRGSMPSLYDAQLRERKAKLADTADSLPGSALTASTAMERGAAETANEAETGNEADDDSEEDKQEDEEDEDADEEDEEAEEDEDASPY